MVSHSSPITSKVKGQRPWEADGGSLTNSLVTWLLFRQLEIKEVVATGRAVSVVGVWATSNLPNNWNFGVLFFNVCVYTGPSPHVSVLSRWAE